MTFVEHRKEIGMSGLRNAGSSVGVEFNSRAVIAQRNLSREFEMYANKLRHKGQNIIANAESRSLVAAKK
jgi:hypothetical protein